MRSNVVIANLMLSQTTSLREATFAEGEQLGATKQSLPLSLKNASSRIQVGIWSAKGGLFRISDFGFRASRF
jgi:hypothetical protein